ncbi:MULTISPECIES: hypothetical protein [unclassified Paraburkholderia]|uniref:hypothetical protein n=1 Tax=unclassified Paraburkholderia TaxID=2615204 RepID=UPI0034CFCECB
MNQLVYVHGVDGPRSDAAGDAQYVEYQTALAARNQMFQNETFEKSVTIRNPLWSVHAAHPAWNLACVPGHVLKAEAGSAPLAIGGILGGTTGASPLQPPGDTLARAAKSDLDAVVGSLSSIAIEQAQSSDPAAVENAVRFWSAAARALENPEARKSLTGATDDKDFLDRLQVAARPFLQDQSLSLFDSVRSAATQLKGATTDLVNSPAVLAVRGKLTPQLAIFIGDVFTYLKAGAARDAIRAEIRKYLIPAASAANAAHSRLIVCGHSMGGVILYDLLTDVPFVQGLTDELGAPFKADLFLTVGSQVALFEELKVFTASSAGCGANQGNKVPKPGCAERWWNVYNRLDVLSFLAKPVFEDVEDLEASTTAGITDAHSAYFTNLVFYRRLNARMKQAGFLP